MKFPAVESVMPRVSQQVPKQGVGVKRRINFFEIETAPVSEDSGNFLESEDPLLQVMDDSEIEHRIETAVPVGETLGIGDKEDRPPECEAEGFSVGEIDHGRIDVYGVYPFRLKRLTHESRAVPTPAADFETVAPLGHGPDSPEVPRFQALDEFSQRAVYPQPLGPVDFHSVPGKLFPEISI